MSDFCSLLQSIGEHCSLHLTFVVFCSSLVNYVTMSDFLQSFVFFCSQLVNFVVCQRNFPLRVCTFLFWSNFPRYKSCSPLSYLSKCVETMLFGIVFMEKNAKNKKKAGSEKNLLPHISTTGALQNIIQTDLGSYRTGLQLLFLYYFWKLVM